MCESTGSLTEAAATAPVPAPGQAVDPIRLEPVDEVRVTTLVDNVYDALLTSDRRTTRAPFRSGTAVAPQFESGTTTVGLMAEHGFSALVTIRRGSTTNTILFDAGLSPDAMSTNAGRLGVDLSAARAIVLSHGHFDHAGGLIGLAGKRGRRSLPMVVHPAAWTRRRMAVPGVDPELLPTLSRTALEAEGFALLERRHPSLLLDDSVLITGEIDRTTEFERGMPPAHQAWSGGQWRPDPLVVDDQALVVHVRGQGLVVLTGCAHAGAVNIVRQAQRLTGVPELHALIGGLHLSGPAFEPIIRPTVEALTELQPALVVPGHCTGWRAQQALAAALPEAFVAGSSGSSYRLAARQVDVPLPA
jgi:7,8-dihydropterin-6-yl-methyl-4-(beta-D-ribofuranosyl)aminobenzene 5'-phosphate synthase